MDQHERWLSTEQAAARIGMTAEWIRRQIVARRLLARVFYTGARATFRIREEDFGSFVDRWSASTDDPDWEEALERRPKARFRGK